MQEQSLKIGDIPAEIIPRISGGISRGIIAGIQEESFGGIPERVIKKNLKETQVQ